jgi:tetratricopeptide (TPR) repeat protein
MRRDAEVARSLAAIQKLGPRFVDDLYHTGWLLVQLGRAGDAVRHLERARELAPWNEATLYALGRAYGDVREWPQAESTLRRLLDLDPDHVHARARLARTVAAQDRAEEATRLYRDALQRAPDDRWIRRDLAIHLFHAVDPEAAFAELAGIREPDLGTLRLEVQLLRQAERWDAAIEAAHAALQRHPDDAQLLTALADSYQRRGRADDWERARETWNRLEAAGSTDEETGAWAAATRALFAAGAHAAGRHELAREAALEGLAQAESAVLRSVLAAAYESLALPADAAEQWGRVVARPAAGLEAAASLRGARYDALAERVLQALVERHPDLAPAWRELGVLCVDGERWEDAAGALGQALWLDPRALDALIRAAAHSPAAARLLRRFGG